MKKRRFIDERGFLFGKVSVVDILALALVLALVMMLYVRFLADKDIPGSLAGVSKEKVEYVVRISNVRDIYLDTMRSGDTVFHGEYGTRVGTVKEVRAEPAIALMTKPDGTVVEAPMEEYYTIYVTMESECIASAGGYYLGGAVDLNLNMTLPLATAYVAISGTVISIN